MFVQKIRLAIALALFLGGAASFGQETSNSSTAINGSFQDSQRSTAVQPPEGFADLSEKHLAYIEQLLDCWEKSSAQIKRCECEFRRWDYNAQILAIRDPKDNRLFAHRFVQGKIRYAAPDQAQYQTTEMRTYQNPELEDPYVKLNGDGDNEKWICDGQAVYDFDFVNRRLYETKIPADQSGTALLNSPLPFFFGAKKEQLISRYWLKVTTPSGVEDEYWLSAVPKRQEDAQIYSKVDIILAQEDFLPKALHIYSANYDPTTTAESRVIVFDNRKINSQLGGFQDFLGIFIRPHTPSGWTRVDTLAEAGMPGEQPRDRTGALMQGSNKK